tara:strand:+ start:502 stop:609 length:108 start_codon:yes stop_codon:yes gene_type:complete
MVEERDELRVSITPPPWDIGIVNIHYITDRLNESI